jgi:hypothetical protein
MENSFQRAKNTSNPSLTHLHTFAHHTAHNAAGGTRELGRSKCWIIKQRATSELERERVGGGGEVVVWRGGARHNLTV